MKQKKKRGVLDSHAFINIKEDMEKTQFYNVLFNTDEYTCFGPTPFETDSYPILDGINSKLTKFFTINPLVKGRTRKGTNVKKYRNFMFEIDNIPVKDQAKLIRASGLPYSTATFSGGKSIHWIISLVEPLEDRVEYTAIWKAIYAALVKCNIEADTATKDPARLSRCPGVMRDNGKEQKLLQVAGRIELEELVIWLQSHSINWEDYLPKQDFKPAYMQDESHSKAENALKIEWVEKYHMKNDRYEDGNYNYQYKMAWFLLATGMSVDEIRSYYMQKWNHIHENKPVLGASQSEVKCDTIYVPTMEERKAYYKNLEQQQQNAIRKERTMEAYKSDIKEDVEADGESEDRYLCVGIEYWKKDAESDRLIKWNKTMFEKLYGANAIPPRLYDAFSYEPDYISENFPYDLGARGQLRNKFVRPVRNITKGDWSTIEAGLRHGFGDMYEFAITYAAIMIKYPKQCLPLLWFVGPENTGKSAVIKIFELLVGLSNARRVNGKILESDFTGFLMDIQLLIIEESGGWKNPVSVMNMIKELVTMQGEVTVNPKYGIQEDYPFYGKVMMSTNNYEDIPLDGKATRFLISEMKTTPPQIKDYYKKIEDEIGYFVYDLLHTVDIKYPSEHRLYFDPKDYSNEAKAFLKDLSKTDLHSSIEGIISDWFQKFPEANECFFDLKTLKVELKKYYRANGFKQDYVDKDIKVCMKKDFDVERTSLLTRPDSLQFKEPVGNLSGDYPDRRSQWWTLERSQLLGEDAIFDASNIS